jgi:hypothetical protein
MNRHLFGLRPRIFEKVWLLRFLDRYRKRCLIHGKLR